MEIGGAVPKQLSRELLQWQVKITMKSAQNPVTADDGSVATSISVKIDKVSPDFATGRRTGNWIAESGIRYWVMIRHLPQSAHLQPS